MTSDFKTLYDKLIQEKFAIREKTEPKRQELENIAAQMAELREKKKAVVLDIKREEKDLVDLNKQISALAAALNGKSLNRK